MLTKKLINILENRRLSSNKQRAMFELRNRGLTDQQMRELGLDFKVDDASKTKKEIMAFEVKHGRVPSQATKNPIEKRLAQCLNNYCRKNSTSFDSEMLVWRNKVCPYLVDPKTFNIEKIKKQYEQTGALPNPNSPDADERKLAYAMNSYLSPGSKMYVSSFRKWKLSIFPPKGCSKEKIRKFCRENNRHPIAKADDSEERKLGQSLMCFCSPKSKRFDPEMRKLRDSFQKTSDITKNEILEFVHQYKRRPKSCAKDPIERRIGRCFANYCSRSAGCFDLEMWTLRASLKK